MSLSPCCLVQAVSAPGGGVCVSEDGGEQAPRGCHGWWEVGGHGVRASWASLDPAPPDPASPWRKRRLQAGGFQSVTSRELRVKRGGHPRVTPAGVSDALGFRRPAGRSAVGGRVGRGGRGRRSLLRTRGGIAPAAAGTCYLTPTSTPPPAASGRARSTRSRGAPLPGSPEEPRRSARPAPPSTRPVGPSRVASVPVDTATHKPFTPGVACQQVPTRAEFRLLLRTGVGGQVPLRGPQGGRRVSPPPPGPARGAAARGEWECPAYHRRPPARGLYDQYGSIFMPTGHCRVPSRLSPRPLHQTSRPTACPVFISAAVRGLRCHM